MEVSLNPAYLFCVRKEAKCFLKMTDYRSNILLNIHHMIYVRQTDISNQTSTNLIVLNTKTHRHTSETRSQVKETMSESPN